MFLPMMQRGLSVGIHCPWLHVKPDGPWRIYPEIIRSAQVTTIDEAKSNLDNIQTRSSVHDQRWEYKNEIHCESASVKFVHLSRQRTRDHWVKGQDYYRKLEAQKNEISSLCWSCVTSEEKNVECSRKNVMDIFLVRSTWEYYTVRSREIVFCSSDEKITW